MYIVAGLGNPGKEYENTRHNIGFMVLDFLAKKLDFNISKIKFKGLTGECVIENEKIIFLKPSTYMNLSGDSIREAVDFYKIPLSNLIVVYDDVDIMFGKIRIRPSGSDAGHNGMKSIIYQLNSNEFPRIRVGIGAANKNMISHVLGSFSENEREILQDIIQVAGDAIIDIIKNGIQYSMNKYNSLIVGKE
ncbi:aminoacyl-tRNA hydrolase [Caloramator sp. E03]|uniref:aminoacyl-tRNA hydrolase n=1 Tax=Caloramator sp. E03 TaxID=2576307 RepID=UPI0011105941|nr:aminoacyl-tRNA hydrolase [Caloramator sp. E03]QCX33744.1 aminoacyl-tRNA hydrolase [Caloramator sp. E03]